MKKLYDLTVKTGSYKNSAGEEKAQWMNIGSVMEKEEGKRFILLNRTFNPAGVPNPDNRDSVLVSMFKPKPKEAPAQADNPFADDSEVPF